MKPAFWLGLLLLLIGPVSGHAADDDATALVQRTATRMLDTLKAQRAAVKADPKLINRLVNDILAPHFDFEAITRQAVGQDWKKATPEQRSALTAGFREMLIRTYANALLKYSDEEIVYDDAKPGTRTDTVVVPTVVRSPGGAPPIPIDYRMHKLGGAWKVYDVIIDNVSLIANYRSQFKTTIGRAGIDGLIKDLNTKNGTGAGA